MARSKKKTKDQDQPIELQGELTWRQMPGEPEAWYLRFMRYCRMGQRRSMLSIYNQEQVEKGGEKALKISGAWQKRVDDLKWTERAALFDAWRNEREQLDYLQKQKTLRKTEYELSQSLIEKAKQMLQFPIARQETSREEADGQIIVYNTWIPSKWTLNDAARMLVVADKLARLALLMETDNSIIQSPGALPGPAGSGSAEPFNIEQIRQKRWKEIKELEHLLEMDEEIDQDQQ